MTDLVVASKTSARLCSRGRINTTTPQTTSRRGLSTSGHLRQTTTSTASPTSTSQSNEAPPATGSLPDITTHYTLFPGTLPAGPPPSGPFTIPLPQLRREFLLLQSLHHPDKYTASPTTHTKAVALSSLINNAYRTLSDPLSRAQYLLLQNYDIDVMSEDNSENQTDQETLMEVMEAQEAVEGAESEQEVETLKTDNRARIEETTDRMGTAFEADDRDLAKRECVRLKYWRSLQQGLDDWEPGKEVRLVH